MRKPRTDASDVEERDVPFFIALVWRLGLLAFVSAFIPGEVFRVGRQSARPQHLLSVGRLAVAIVATAGVAFISMQPAIADNSFHVNVVTQPASPIALDYCYAGFTNTDVGNINYYINEAVSFTNVSQQTVTAVEFRFDMLDDFNSILGSRYGQKSGEFSPGVLIEARHNVMGTPNYEWESINIWNGMTGVQCSVSKVKFADGTIWSAAAAGTPNTAPSSNPFSGGAGPAATPRPKRVPAPKMKPNKIPSRVTLNTSQRVDPLWKERAISCDVLYTRALIEGATSLLEREAFLSSHPDIKKAVDDCDTWRDAHPVAGGSPSPVPT